MEDLRLLTGHGTFVDDVSRPGMLHARFVRSPLARARVLGVDASAALALEGVHAVFLAGDLNPGVHEAWYTIVGKDVPDSPRPPLAEGEVRFVGDPVALVIASDRYEMCIMLAARKVPGSLKWIEDRQESLLAAGQARHAHGDVRMAFDVDGRFLAARIDYVEDVGAYPMPYPLHNAAAVGMFFPGPTGSPRPPSRSPANSPTPSGVRRIAAPGSSNRWRARC